MKTRKVKTKTIQLSDFAEKKPKASLKTVRAL